MMSSEIETLGQTLLDATCQVFEANGAPLSDASRCDPASDWLDPVAVIGFGGEAVRGCVSFEVPWRVLQQTHPTRSSTTVDLADWVGELANLTLGTLKTKLRARAVPIQLGLPTTFTVPDTHRGAMSPAQLQFRLRSIEGSVRVRLSAEVDADFKMGEPTPVAAAVGIDLF
jgi:CheY-specific phosphatase CheX